MGNKLIFYIRDGLDMGLEWVHISLLPVSYLCFGIGENINPYLNPVKVGEICQIRFGSDGYP